MGLCLANGYSGLKRTLGMGILAELGNRHSHAMQCMCKQLANFKALILDSTHV